MTQSRSGLFKPRNTHAPISLQDIFGQGPLTDERGRSFDKISPLQFYAWTYHLDNLRLCLKQLDEQFAGAVYKQLLALNTLPTAHYNFRPLIEAYEALINASADEKEALFVDLAQEQAAMPYNLLNDFLACSLPACKHALPTAKEIYTTSTRLPVLQNTRRITTAQLEQDLFKLLKLIANKKLAMEELVKAIFDVHSTYDKEVVAPEKKGCTIL